MIVLNKNQLERLYMVFDFEDHEEIVSATMDCDRGGWMEINYIDHKDNTNGCYKPYLAKHSTEDLEKVSFILNGFKLKRESN